MKRKGELIMNGNTKKVFKALTMITQIGISMMVPVFLCLMFGKWLDRLFHTQGIILVMLLIGIGAAFRNVYIITKSFYAADMEKEHEQLDYIRGLKEYSKQNHDKEDDKEGFKE